MTSKQAIILFVPIVVFVALMFPLKDGFTDDGYIHIQYARNIIERGEYSFNPGEVSFGTTSPLWVLLLAAIGSVFGGDENLVLYSRILSWLAGAGAVVLVFFLGRALGARYYTAWAAALVLGAHAWHVRWSALSMETSSAVFLTGAVGLAALDAAHSPRKAWVLGLLMALASLMRPEAYLLVPIYLVAFLLVRRRSLACLARTLGMYALLIGPWLVFARFHLGSFLPNTAGAKSGGLTLNPITLFAKMQPVAKITGSTEGIMLAAIVVSILVLRRRTRVLAGRVRFLLLWIVALPIAYVVFDVQILSRYLLLTTPFTIALGFVALEELATNWVRSKRASGAIVVAAAVVAVALNISLFVGIVVGPSRAFSSGLGQNLKRLAVYIDDNSANDAVVAAIDIGYLGFYGNRRVLDLGGLVDRSTHEIRLRHTYEEVVQQGLYLGLETFPHVEFLVDRETVANRFDGRTVAGHRLEAVQVEQIDNLGIRKPGPWFYTLYRLHPVSQP